MIIQKKVKISLQVAVVLFLVSFVFNIIPCQTAADLPNPIFSWKMCSMNPDTAIANTGKTIYLGLTESLSATYLLIFGAGFVITFLLLSLLSKKVNEGR